MHFKNFKFIETQINSGTKFTFIGQIDIQRENGKHNVTHKNNTSQMMLATFTTTRILHAVK